MKTKKLIVSVLLFMLVTVLFAFGTETDAASSSGLGNLRITKERIGVENYKPDIPSSETSNPPYTVTYKHQLHSDNADRTKNVWKIVSANTDTTEKLPDLYCLRAGLGFTTEGPVDNEINAINYDLAYDLPEDYEKVKTYLSGLNSEVTIFEDKDSFNAVLKILDIILLEKDMENPEKVKEYLINYAGYTSEDIENKPLSVLSSADIEVIQQLAIWYFTNQEDKTITEEGEEVTYKPYHTENLSRLYSMLSCEAEDFYNTYDEVNITNPDGTVTTRKNYKYVGYDDPAHPYNTELDEHTNPILYGSMRQAAAERLYKALIANGKAAAEEVKEDTTNTNGLYTPLNREITVYLAGKDAAKEQPVVQIRDKEADIALRKFISKVNDEKLETSREPKVDTSKFNTLVGDEFQTTAIYNHPKKPVSVSAEDIITYTIRLYNEGEVPAYIKEVRDYLPKWLQIDITDTRGYFRVLDEGNTSVFVTTPYCEIVGAGGLLDYEDIKEKAKADPSLLYLANIEIPAAKKNTAENAKPEDSYILSYVDIEIKCKVKKDTPKEVAQTNIAEVTKMTSDLAGEIALKDRDSQVQNAVISANEENPAEPAYRPNYTGGDNEKTPYYNEENVVKAENGDKYYPGQQDDDDFDKVIISHFDLALRKFITKTGESPVNNRIPEVIYKNGKLSYNHRKDPVPVMTGDVVVYTIRIFNEGRTDGYANEITDDMPEGLEFLPENETNVEYRWTMLDENQKPTKDVSKAKYIVTDYLSEDQEEETGRNNLLKAFDPDAEITQSGVTPANPDYRDVQVAFKVTYVPTTKEETKRVLVNVAQISDDSDDDIDSEPSRDEKYDKGGDNEDDIDYDNVIVKYFDLALLKWVSQTKVTLNGETVITDTGHTAETARDEDAVLISIKEKDLKKVTIKYVYTIRVTNQGEIDGYATEIKDHIPEGLEFFEADNTEYGWKEVSGGIITTDYLKDTLLLANEQNYAEVKVVLTWINNPENLGEKVNLAEISKDKNKGDVPDIDSTPDNLEPGRPYEDDEDDAPVILALQTGSEHLYIGLMGAVLLIFAAGVTLIKKYVL